MRHALKYGRPPVGERESTVARATHAGRVGHPFGSEVEDEDNEPAVLGSEVALPEENAKLDCISHKSLS